MRGTAVENNPTKKQQQKRGRVGGGWVEDIEDRRITIWILSEGGDEGGGGEAGGYMRLRDHNLNRLKIVSQL